MFNYIKAEMYKWLRRPLLYVSSLIIMSLIVFIFLVVSDNAPMEARGVLISIANEFLSAILIFVVILTSIFLEEFKEGTLKNIASYGLNKEKIFLGKIIIESIIFIMICIACLITFIICIYAFTIPYEGYSNASLLLLLTKFLVGLPLYLGGIALVNMLMLFCKKEFLLPILYIIILNSRQIILYLEYKVSKSFIYVYRLLLTSQLSKLKIMESINSGMISIALIGAVYTIVFVLIGMKIFRKQEIK